MKLLKKCESVSELIDALEEYRDKPVSCCGGGNCAVYIENGIIIIDDNNCLADEDTEEEQEDLQNAKPVLTSKEEIVLYVRKEYEKGSVELSGAYFDFYCGGMSGYELFEAYVQLQDEINGDTVCFVRDIQIAEDGTTVIGGRLVEDNLVDPGHKEVFKRKITPIPEDMTAEEWLKSLDGLGVYRLMDLKTKDDNEKEIERAELLSLVY